MIQKCEDALPRVTVAVCTRDRTDYLPGCLNAIRRLAYPQIDVLLIDNAPSTDATMILVQNEFTWVRYLVEPRPGLDWARNRAIVEARGDIIAFNDDDVVVDPEWIDAVVRVFEEDSQIMAVTGLVTPYELETEAQILFERYGGFVKGLERRRIYPEKRAISKTALASGDIGTAANMAFRRSVFDNIGLFDPALYTGTVTRGR